jgi:hypothetical protein
MQMPHGFFHTQKIVAQYFPTSIMKAAYLDPKKGRGFIYYCFFFRKYFSLLILALFIS